MAGQGVSTAAVLTAAGGALFLWSGIKGGSVTASLRSLLSASPQLSNANANPITGTPAAALAGAPGGGGAPTGDTSAHSQSAASNQAIGRMLAAKYGWGSGPEWDALVSLWNGESGWSNTAQNPTSTAFGIAQFLDSTWAGTGFGKTSDPTIQIEAGLLYIKARYGSPSAAYSAWLSRNPHWY